MPVQAFGEPRYVIPSAEIPVRSGQGGNFKIVAVVTDGTRVDLVEEHGAWARIRLASEKEGWILKRYLSVEPPLKEKLERMRAEHDQLEQSADQFRTRFNKLLENHKKTVNELERVRSEKEEILRNYEVLKKDAADVIQLREALSGADEKLQQARRRLTTVEEENRRLKSNYRVKWFLAGGAVLAAGWLIGLATARGRKRKSSLY